ncbi:helicase-related protein [Parachitinimonas caeni]
MMADGYCYNARRSLGPACLSFLREHGVLKDVYKSTDGGSHKTAKGDKVSHHTSKAPGFGPLGIMRFVVPITAFLKLQDIDGNVLPPYDEQFQQIRLSADQSAAYQQLSVGLTRILKKALAARDKTLLGVVLNTLLAWPDCCFRPEVVRHPQTRQILAEVPALVDDVTPLPKEQALINLCKAEKQLGRKVLAYTIYTATRDTTARLKHLLEREGFKVGVLRSSVGPDKREDWVLEQVERGIDVMITNPELVKTGLDLLDFPTIVFMQSGYSIYTLMQAAKRAWRIGQRQACRTVFLGYAQTAQTVCLQLMARKILVAQSTSGDMPESGLDVLNQDDESVEVALAKQLLGEQHEPRSRQLAEGMTDDDLIEALAV